MFLTNINKQWRKEAIIIRPYPTRKCRAELGMQKVSELFMKSCKWEETDRRGDVHPGLGWESNLGPPDR